MLRRILIVPFLLSLSMLPLGPAAAQSSKSRPASTSKSSSKKATTASKSGASKKKATSSAKEQKSSARSKSTKTTAKQDDKRSRSKTTSASGSSSQAKAKSSAPKPAAIAKSKASVKPSAAKPAAPATATQKPAQKPASTSPAPVSPDATRPPVLVTADAAYDRGNHAEALKLYRQAIAEKVVTPEDRPGIDYRIARSLASTGQHAEAITEALRLASANRGTLWEARAKLALMHFYLDAPHEGWKVGNRYYRGGERPQTPEGVEAERLDFTSEDLRKAELYGNEARLAYGSVAKDAAVEEELLSHTLDLVRLVSATQLRRWLERGEWPAVTDPAWQIDPEATYDTNWAPPKKIFYLFQYAEQMAPAARKAQVRLASVVWQREYHQSAAARRQRDAYPYGNVTVAEAVKAMGETYPGHTATEQAQLLLGDWLAEDGQHGAALQAYETLAQASPKSRWGQSAKAAAARLSQVDLELRAPTVQRPGQAVRLWVKARNAGQVKFTARRLRLEQVVREARVLLRADAGVDDLVTRMGGARALARFCDGDPVEWDATLSEPGKQETVTREIEAPLRELGAYLVETEAGSARAAAVVVISDLAVVQIADSTRTLALVVDAETGQPVPEASVMIRELYTDANGKKAVSAVTRTTDAEGLAEKPHSPRREYSDDVLSFAWKDQRYALSASAWKVLSDRGTPVTVAHVETDRAQYEPNDTVRFRILAAGREGENWKPLSGSKLRLRITSPNGKTLVNREVTAAEWGTVHGEYAVPEKAAAGRYEITVTRGTGAEAETLGTAGFFVGVESVPSVQVAVVSLPSSDDAGPRVRVSVRTADGKPVPETAVRYTARGVAGPGVVLAADGASGSPVVSGTVTTDARGDAVVKLEGLAADASGGVQRYQVLAQAEDALGRTASGGTQVEVQSAPVHVTLQAEQGFYQPEQPVKVTVRARDAAGKAISLRGRVRVVRLVAEEGKLREEEIRDVAIRDGAEEFTWKTERAGRYEVRLEARDEAGHNLSTRTTVWVVGAEARLGVPPGREVLLVPERSAYQPGETARVLVLTREAGHTFLETQEAGARILTRKLRSGLDAVSVLEVPIPAEAAGGMSLGLTGMRGGELVRRVVPLVAATDTARLRVEVVSEQKLLRPGDRAKLRIRTLGADGRPVSARVSLAVVSGASSGEAGRAQGSPFQVRPRVASLRAQDSIGVRFQSWVAPQPELPNAERPTIDPWNELGLLDSALLQKAAQLGQPTTAVAPDAAEMTAASQPEMPAPKKSEPSSSPAPQAPAPEAAAPVAAGMDTPIRSGGSLAGGGQTVFWTPEIITDADGYATVEVPLPSQMGQFRVVASGWTADAALAQGSVDLQTRKDVVVRVPSPEMQDGDQVTVTAYVRNLTDHPEQVRVRLTLTGEGPMPQPGLPIGPPEARPLFVPRADRPQPANTTAGAEEELPDPFARTVRIPAGAEERVVWTVRLPRNKGAGVRVEAVADTDRDSAEIRLGEERSKADATPGEPASRSVTRRRSRK